MCGVSDSKIFITTALLVLKKKIREYTVSKHTDGMKQMNRLLDRIQERFKERLQERLLALALGVLVVASLVYVGRETAYYVTGKNISVSEGGKCVVIDAGHGGSK